MPFLANDINHNTDMRRFGFLQPSVFYNLIGQFDLRHTGFSRVDKAGWWMFQTISNMADFTKFAVHGANLFSPLFRKLL